jgi:hypothetical protein
MLAMRTVSPRLADVVRDLPALLVRSLDADRVGHEVDALVAAGWRPGQLGARIGAAPSLGSPDRDADHVLQLLSALRDETPPDVAHARELERRRRDRADERARAPQPASPEVQRRSAERIRAELGLAPRRAVAVEPRTRPACSLCDGEGSFFVSPEVHLCPRCVAVLATGSARLADTG